MHNLDYPDRERSESTLFGDLIIRRLQARREFEVRTFEQGIRFHSLNVFLQCTESSTDLYNRKCQVSQRKREQGKKEAQTPKFSEE